MIIRKLISSDIDSIWKVHQKNLNSPGSKIGPTYLKKLYENLASNPNLHFCLVALENDKICGCITATKDLELTFGLLKKSLDSSVYYAILNRIISGKINIKELINRLRLEHWAKKKFKKPYIYIVGLFVDKNLRGKGIGTRLIKAIIGKVKKNKIKRIYVDTSGNNQTALNFYSSKGFRSLKKIEDNIILKYELK